jgi:ribosomal protein S18 acetylase RimI-like enzyme
MGCAGRALAKMAIEEMVRGEAEEVVLEAEVTNTGALALYRSLGFVRDKHLHRCAS